MFDVEEKNKIMLEGSYKKLKSYYYYNKNFLLMRGKIAEFESDREAMEKTFCDLSNYLAKPQSKISKEYFLSLFKKIDFFVIPKKFEAKDISNKPISNTLPRDKKMKTVNFFIDMPIELHILDALWTLFLAKMSYDRRLLSYDVYGNTIVEKVLFDNKDKDEPINFENNRLFNIYFPLYSKWRNRAFESLDRNYSDNQNSVLISLDIKAYFYSVKCDFAKLSEMFESHELLKHIRPLSFIMEKVYENFFIKITQYRKDILSLGKKQYPLPIGLFSSMIIGNLYLNKFDRTVRKNKNLSYYGRYVDDLLFVFKKTISKDDTNESIIAENLVESGLLSYSDDDYCIKGCKNLMIQSEKIKVIYIDHTESKAIIDIYNDTIRIIPSQMDPIPDYKLDLSDFDENVYSVENFGKESKLRDIGQLGIDSYKVGRYFSLLVYKHVNINSYDDISINAEIDEQIPKIEKFFSGSQGIEFYSNWLNYMYFLVITQRNKQLREFYKKMKLTIQELDFKSLDKSTIKKPSTVNKKAKETLLTNLNICLYLVLAIDIDMAERHFKKEKIFAKKYQNANLFNHNLIALPLTNYLEYENDISYIKMQVKNIDVFPSNVENSFKFQWSPRFIHFEEIWMLLFYYRYKQNQKMVSSDFIFTSVIDKFQNINKIKFKPFEITIDTQTQLNQYNLHMIQVPDNNSPPPKKINIGVGNIKLSRDDLIRNLDRWKCISLNNKNILRNILREANLHCKQDVKLLVFPELYIPIYWIKELIDFSKKSQIAIVTGLQYMLGDNNRVHNYIATILPFETGKNHYKNAFIYIREKNDYSPLEKELLATRQLSCYDRKTSDYQIFKWKGIDLSTFVCFELTDISARALLKGKCDVIAVPVLNADTAYFSNIIDTTVRDLHSIIVQANTSYYGDSRVTGPYDKDHKDIFKIKGGDNEHVLIGTIDFKEITEFQANYYLNEQIYLRTLSEESMNKYPEYPIAIKTTPDIKKLSARFKNKRTKNEDD